MADFRSSKLIGSTASLNSAFSPPLNRFPHLGNFTILPSTSFPLPPRRRGSQHHQFLAHSASPICSLASRIDIVSTTERSDGTLLFKFGDPSEIVVRKGNSDSEPRISEEGNLENEVASFRKAVVEEETGVSGKTKQGQTVEVILDTTEDANGKETAAVVKEESFSVRKENEVCGEANCTKLSSGGDSAILQTFDEGNKETLTSFIDERYIKEEGKKTLPDAVVDESKKPLVSIVDEENKETLDTAADQERPKSLTSVDDDKGAKTLTILVAEENKENLITSVEQENQKSPKTRVLEESKETATNIVDLEDEETLAPSAGYEHNESPPTSVVDEESEETRTRVVDEENQETWTSFVEEEHKKSPTTNAEEVRKKSLTSVGDKGNKGTPMSPDIEEKKENMTSVVENLNNLQQKDNYGKAQALTLAPESEITDVDISEENVQEVEEIKIIDTTSSPLSHEHELHVEGYDDIAEVQEMDVNPLNAVSLDASVPTDSADVDDYKKEIKSNHARMEPILVEEQLDQLWDDLASAEEALSAIMVDDSASDKSSHSDRIYGDVAISCIAKEEDQQLLDTGLIDTVERFEKGEKLYPTLVLAAGVASSPLPSKALTGEVDAYFVAGENWFGVANGVGQWSFEGTKVGSYAQEFLQNCETLVCNSSFDEVSEVGDAFRQSAASVKSPGLASVLIAYFDNKVLHVANVGDTGYMVIRNGSVLQRSSPMAHDFSLPVLIGTSDVPEDITKEYQVEIEEGDMIIIATDGLFDNLYEHDILSIISKSFGANMTNKEVAEELAEKALQVGTSRSARSPFADAAQAAGYAGYAGGKPDHVTVIVSLVKKR